MMIFKSSREYVAECPEYIKPGRTTLKKGWQVEEGFMPIPCDIVVEKDVSVRMRDGVTLYVDVFRPATEEKVPVLISWSPYGKDKQYACQL